MYNNFAGMSPSESKRFNSYFTEEQWECIRVCVANAPIPYDITLKKIPVEILDKIGQPKRVQHEGELMVECDLEQYQ